MADKKNLVIKLKYPAGVKKTTRSPPSPVTVSEWDMRRVGLAIVAVILAVVLAGVLFFHEQTTPVDDGSATKAAIAPVRPTAQSTAQQPQRSVSLPNPVVEAVPASETTPLPVYPKQGAQTPIPAQQSPLADVSRALLTYKIKKHAAMTEIPKLVRLGKHRSMNIHYFTEVGGNVGHDIYHEWVRNGKVIMRYTFNLQGDYEPISSRMAINVQSQGDWVVRLLDENNQLLNQQTFTVANPF